MKSSHDAPDSDKVATYWDANPARGNWGTLRQELRYMRKKENCFFESMDRIPRGNKVKVLDIGCGQGIDTYYLTLWGFDVTGIDLSRESVRIANRRLVAVGLGPLCQTGNAEDLPFEAKTFDAVVSMGVLHHTPNIRQASDEILRVLKPGGFLSIMLYRRYSVQFTLLALARPIMNRIYKTNKGSYEKRRYKTIWAEQWTCPIINTYTKRSIHDLFPGFSGLTVKAKHTGLSRVIDFVTLPLFLHLFLCWIDRLIEPWFGCYLFIEGKKELHPCKIKSKEK